MLSQSGARNAFFQLMPEDALGHQVDFAFVYGQMEKERWELEEVREESTVDIDVLGKTNLVFGAGRAIITIIAKIAKLCCVEGESE
jgi:hypothetical protein